MGNWHISIQGVGVHHNRDNPTDANRMAAKFVEDLKAAGHSVNVATFTHGAADDINEINDASPWYERLPRDLEAAGEAAYNAYGDARAWTTFAGEPMPTWGEQSGDLRAAWCKAAEALLP